MQGLEHIRCSGTNMAAFSLAKESKNSTLLSPRKNHHQYLLNMLRQNSTLFRLIGSR